MTPDSLKKLFRRIFTRRGSNGRRLRLFEDLDPPDQEKLLGRFQLETEELPVVGCISAAGDELLLLTTERLMWTRDEKMTIVKLEDLIEATVDFDALAKRRTSLLTTTILNITVRGGQHVIRLEPGKPFSGMWNVLLTITLRNRRNAILN